MLMSEPLRVLQICAGFNLESLGGVERYTFDLSRALRRLGVQVSIAGLWQFGGASEQEWMRQLHAAGVDTFAGAQKNERAPLRNLIDSIQQLRRALAPRTFDIIHSQQEFGDIAAIALRPAVHAHALARSVHNDPEWRQRPLRRLLLTHLAAPILFQAENGITVRIAERLNRRRVASMLGRRAGVIHNAIDLSRFAGDAPDKQEARHRLSWPTDALVIGSVGRLSEQKGYLHLVRAAPLVRQHLPNAHFRVVGSGELRTSLQHEIDALGLSDVFVLDGARSNMRDVYAGMDLFVSSSLWEGLPTVILEAMTAGVPVMATAVDGTTDLITHGTSGWLATNHSPEALAEAIVHACATTAQTEAMTDNARRVAAAYHIDGTAAQWLDVYHTLLKHTPRASAQANS